MRNFKERLDGVFSEWWGEELARQGALGRVEGRVDALEARLKSMGLYEEAGAGPPPTPPESGGHFVDNPSAAEVASTTPPTRATSQSDPPGMPTFYVDNICSCAPAKMYWHYLRNEGAWMLMCPEGASWACARIPAPDAASE